MSQPTDRSRMVSAPGTVREDIGEFWVANPWQFPDLRKNLSSYERNRVFLNRGGMRFHDVSFLSGADSDGDGRSSVAADLNDDGMLDLVVRQSGGGSLLVYENRFPRRHYLAVSLRGTKSNRQGIGARIILESAGRRQARDLYPVDTFMSQSAAMVHLGIGRAESIDSLTVHWPSGKVQKFRDLPIDRHLLLEEGTDTVRDAAVGPWTEPEAGSKAGGFELQ